jgi:hypothetical protein
MKQLAMRAKALELEAELQRVLLANKIRSARQQPGRAWVVPAIGAIFRLATGRQGFWRMAAAFIVTRFLASKPK